jgi:DNA topoisomerase III
MLQGTAYAEWAKNADRSIVHKNNKYVCNPEKVEDHHAILPTTKKAVGLSPDEEKLYDLIVRRFLSQFYAPAAYKLHTVMTEVEGESFKTSVKELLALGWKVIYADQKKAKSSSKKKDEEDEEEEEVTVPFTVNPELDVLCTDASSKEKETQPPKHFTEGTLLKAMESAGKQIENDELRDAMKDAGLGTPATRAATIERLKSVGYIDMQGKKIMITIKGRTAIELIRAAGVELLASPEMTGQWERRLNEIAKGKASAEVFMGNVKKFATMIVDKVRMQARASQERFQAPDKPAEAAGKKKSTKKSDATSAATSNAPKRKRKPSTETISNVDNNAALTGPNLPSKPMSPNPTAELKVIALCPKEGCGGSIIMGRKGYGCSHYKAGCSYVIWKDLNGVILEDSHISTLLERGQTNLIPLQMADGSTIMGRLTLMDRQAGTIEVEHAAHE